MKRRVLTALSLAYCTAIPASQLVIHIPEKGPYSVEISDPVRIDELCQWFFDTDQTEADAFKVITEEGEELTSREYLHPGNDQEVWVDEEEGVALHPKKTYIGYRDYEKKATQSQKNDITFILSSLATKSVPWLLKNKSKLSAAGDRIDGMHPLRFLEVVFTEEELKVYLHNTRKRGGKGWNEFICGIKGTLQDEYEISNSTDGMLFDFASNVRVDYSVLKPSFSKGKWDDFIKALIIHAPREGDSNRYDQ